MQLAGVSGEYVRQPPLAVGVERESNEQSRVSVLSSLETRRSLTRGRIHHEVSF
ncbi:hypothetical protein Pla8534_22810 [Lignipirellula cremea]|uniref:Uncharacterized protein n=1 Tax=Lignipirellula cremea TaxID=2528010 RepID=A0A518DRL8_9BACT|nr:hypothetical protein Pla8534_22810 [Lignipirellula cremea]